MPTGWLQIINTIHTKYIWKVCDMSYAILTKDIHDIFTPKSVEK